MTCLICGGKLHSVSAGRFQCISCKAFYMLHFSLEKIQDFQDLAADGDDTISQTQELLEILEAGPDFLEDFDAELFGELVNKIIVESNERIRFRLKNGLELGETIERTRR